jgi:hypothetical protein
MRNKAGIIYLFITFVITLVVSKLDAQEAGFGWSLGDIGGGYDFLNGYDVADGNILKFNFSFDQINVMISTSLIFATGKNNHGENEPFYNSFLPLEIVYTPFKWKYANISLYGRGSWETGYTGGVDNPNKVSDGFYGSAGMRIGLMPISSNIFKYSSNRITVFSEYTTHNEYKLGVSTDVLTLVILVLKIWSIKNKNNDNSYGAH